MFEVCYTIHTVINTVKNTKTRNKHKHTKTEGVG